MPISIARDLCDFYEYTGRTIPRRQWITSLSDEEMDAAQDQIDATLNGMM